MDFIINLLAFVFTLGIIVSIHELGHLIFARRAGMLCYEYSIGLGPALYKKKGVKTDFSIRAIPIGGYVSIAGEQISTEMIKKGQLVGLNFVDGKIKEMVLSNAYSEVKMQVEDFEIYSEHGEEMFLEGYIDGELKRYQILDDAIYKMPNQDMKIAPYKVCFESKTYLEKFLTLIAGPMMNFILAILIFFVVAAFTGAPVNTSKLGGVSPNNPAANSGLKKGDVITHIDGNEINNWSDIGQILIEEKEYQITLSTNEIIKVNPRVDITQLGISNYNEKTYEVSTGGAIIGTYFGPNENTLKTGDEIIKISYQSGSNSLSFDVNSYQDILDKLALFDGGDAKVTFIRDGEEKEVTLTVWEKQVLKSQGIAPYNIVIGITPEYKFNFAHTLTYPFIKTYDSFYQVLMVLKFLFGGSKQIGVKQLSGPVGIFSIVGLIASQGFIALLAFIGFLSVNIGVLNLLPIPALDGGRILFISIEAISGKKIPRKAENIVNNVFFMLLMLLFVYVTFNDVLRLF